MKNPDGTPIAMPTWEPTTPNSPRLASKPQPLSPPCRDAEDESRWIKSWLGLDLYTEPVVAMANAVCQWCKSVLTHDAGFLLILAGDTGTGKTHCIDGARRWSRDSHIAGWERGKWDNPWSSAYADWPSIIDSLVNDEKPELWDEIVSSDVVFVDDIGSEVDRFRSGQPTEMLRRFLGFREGRFTMATTNIRLEDWPKRWDLRVNDRLLRRSRISTTFGVPSYAIRKATHLCE
jgi:DNA replication protein DnaC